jgi:NADPH-dependent 2,4-dienoyl-CoA reductase/sulfur reductase-like enzyme
VIEHLVVVGASLAGLRAVTGARTAGFTGPITLIGAERYLPYDRPPLSKAFLEAVAEPEVPTHREVAALRDDPALRMILGAPATRLDTSARTVFVNGAAVEYEALVIATGAVPIELGETAGMAGVHTLRGIDDARAVRRALAAGAGTVVIGAGFIGAEIAAGARARGVPVTIVEALPVPMARAVGPVAGAALARLHERNGTTLRCGVRVLGIEETGDRKRVLLSDGSSVTADLVVVGVGATPATGWLHGSGVEVSDGVLCDEFLATNVPGVYAAGDVARWHNPLYGRRMRLEHWASAAEHGAIAARNAVVSEQAVPARILPYFWSDWYGQRIQFMGIPDGDHVHLAGDIVSGGFVALYRDHDRVVGALAIARPPAIMMLRKLVGEQADWGQALALVEQLTQRHRSQPVG